MTQMQKIIQHIGVALAIFLAIAIIGGLLSATGLLGGFISSDAVLDETKAYTLTDNITALTICIRAADLTIQQADHFSVESNLKYLDVQQTNGTLMIKDQKRLHGSYNDAVVTVSIPAGITFTNASITSGAGILTIDRLSAKDLSLELGAGQVNIQHLTANQSADIDGGAGEITISNGKLLNLELDMGVGQLNLTSALQGKSELNLGIGESNITLLGSEKVYGLDIEKGLGNITVNGNSVSDYKTHGEHQVEIDGGVGSIHVEFQ